MFGLYCTSMMRTLLAKSLFSNTVIFLVDFLITYHFTYWISALKYSGFPLLKLIMIIVWKVLIQWSLYF